ncbi:hypothetical protein V500_01535 [Pseudogymnoascus sp. VKM F-4518 (FW-2643)]|nr:hypothetical protein V500_01535 [Pseudogymnoascus sp. VKM F-4518 (FW-2643)]
MAFERQTTPRDVPFNPTRPLSELDPAPSTVSYIRTEPIRHSTVIDDTSREVIVDIAWDPYLYVKNDLRTWPAASEAKIWTPGPNNITLTFVPSLGDRSKDPSEFIQSLPQYKKHGANPDSKRNILLSWRVSHLGWLPPGDTGDPSRHQTTGRVICAWSSNKGDHIDLSLVTGQRLAATYQGVPKMLPKISRVVLEYDPARTDSLVRCPCLNAWVQNSGHFFEPTMAEEAAAADVVADPSEEDESDLDSGCDIGFDSSSSTTSLAESLFDYPCIHGRTYANFLGTSYWLPNDEAAREALDIAHNMYDFLLNKKLFLAPIGDNPQKVIDIGTGTGIWAIDFADQFPSAEVTATDISPILPNLVPPNLRFEIDDARLEWTHAPNIYDFIHIRGLLGCISDWPKLYSRAFRTTKPGGWLENMEMDMRVKFDNCNVSPEHILFDWATPFIESGDKIGTTFDVAGKMKGWMEHAGFVNVTEKRYKIPFSGKSELAQWNRYFYNSDLEGFALLVLIERMKWSYSAVQVYLAEVRAALRDEANQAYYEVTAVYGQKPK